MEKTIDRIDEAVENLREYVNLEIIPRMSDDATRTNFNIGIIPRVFMSLVLGEKIRNETIEEKARNVFEGITRDDLIKEIIKHSLKVAVSKEDIPLNDPSKRFLKELKDNNISSLDVVDYLKRDEFLLCELTISFAVHRYQEKIDLEKIEISNDKRIKKYINYLEETNNEKTNTSFLGKVRNLLFNKSKKDTILNAQCNKDHIDYQVGDLSATTEKEKQEERLLRK